MIISRTPFRVSFFGGGTDYPVWYQAHGGAVLATTIDKYCYISCRYLPPFFEHKSRVAYSVIESVKSNDDIKHPAVRGVLDYLKFDHGVEIHHDGDLPARAGLGSSSAFTVGLLHALKALRQKMATKMELAEEAIKIEQEILTEHVGSQDQVMAAHGGLSRVDFLQDNSIRATPVILNEQRLTQFQDHLLLFYTGLSRNASVIAKEQIDLTPARKIELSEMYDMVSEGVSILTKGEDFSRFGSLLDRAWQLKRKLSPKIATPFINQAYDAARSAGALGGKLLGAGGGGFLLLFAKPETHVNIKEALRGLLRVPFSFETMGSQIIFYQPSQLIERDFPADLRFHDEEDGDSPRPVPIPISSIST